MTHAYTALIAAEWVHTADTLQEMLDFLAEIHEANHGESIAVWQDERLLVAVVLDDGEVLHLEAGRRAAR